MEAVTDNTAFAKEQTKPGYKKTKLGWIPEEWKMLPIKNLTTKIGDGLHSTPRYSENTEYYFINGNNLVENKILITENTKCVDEEEYLKHKKNLDNSTLFLSINGTIGNIAFYNNEKVVLGKSAAYLNIDSTNSKEYLAYQLQTHTINNLFKRVSTGSTIKNLGLKEIQKIELPIPPLPEQQKIASILSTWDKAIAAQEQLIAQKQELKKGLMQELLTGKKRFDGFTEEWEEVKLSEVSDFKNGKGHEQFIDADGQYVVVNSKFISTEGKVRKYTQKQASPLSKDDIVMVMSDVPNGKALAKCYLIEDDNKYSLNQRICSLTAKNINTKFLYYQLNRNKFYLKFNDGLSQTNLKKKEVLGCPILVPSLKEQVKIVETIEASSNSLDLLIDSLRKIKKQKQGLMQQLLTGEKRVKI
ncbi:hypothetical protein BST91_02670 [Nonlabens tegetincola]|uniref:restriction endonuclease subunit S n=1 Tax=Nonlabens tegetincola TaxID=323273 RepID=UPI000A20C3D1|nr:restriction endonuclease subunit S [Nonlabens tegetincola]ARN70627.1 hypothetical protein BST91_02670 [Nonlabens tegetincola]